MHLIWGSSHPHCLYCFQHGAHREVVSGSRQLPSSFLGPWNLTWVTPLSFPSFSLSFQHLLLLPPSSLPRISLISAPDLSLFWIRILLVKSFRSMPGSSGLAQWLRSYSRFGVWVALRLAGSISRVLRLVFIIPFGSWLLCTTVADKQTQQICLWMKASF